MKKKTLTPKKACKILHDKEVRGKPLTKPQRGLMGARCSGAPIKRTRKRK